jgi:hypothetical protein
MFRKELINLDLDCCREAGHDGGAQADDGPDSGAGPTGDSHAQVCPQLQPSSQSGRR